MDGDELQACKDALSEIIAKCESYKGLVESYGEEEGADGMPEADVAVVVEAEPAEEAAESVPEELPPPMSLTERPSDRGVGEVPRKRGPGRPRKGGY